MYLLFLFIQKRIENFPKHSNSTRNIAHLLTIAIFPVNNIFIIMIFFLLLFFQHSLFFLILYHFIYLSIYSSYFIQPFIQKCCIYQHFKCKVPPYTKLIDTWHDDYKTYGKYIVVVYILLYFCSNHLKSFFTFGKKI